MLENIKKFLATKKEVLVFVLVLAIIFTTVITVIRIAYKEAKPVSGGIESSEDIGSLIPSSSADDYTYVEPKKEYKFNLPVVGEYKVVREFFDEDIDQSLLEQAIIYTGSYYVESKGVSYSSLNDEVIDVYNIYPGIVSEINFDETNGYVVSIIHEDGLKSIYSSLSEVSVGINQEIDDYMVIGKSGSRVYDLDAGNHIHLEILNNNTYINPVSLYGKEIYEVINVK